MQAQSIHSMDNRIITLEGVSAAYGSKTVLSGVSLDVYERDYLGVIGPNGGGKTTLVRLILGLMKPTEGRIRYYKQGKEVGELTMGYLPQYNAIDRDFPISVYEVVLSGLNRQKRFLRPYTKAQHEQARQTIARLQLNDLQERPICALSGGQLQRVLLARAIVSRPDVVVLDEPNTYIDKRFQEQMYETLADIHQECAIIIVSHDIAEVLQNVRHVACVNHHVHYHETADLKDETIERHFLNIH